MLKGEKNVRIVQVNNLHQQIGVALRRHQEFGEHQENVEDVEDQGNVGFDVHQDAIGDAMEAIDLI